jgi:ubiquitin C-terminal hydrolase
VDGGHYSATIKNANGKWYNFNDTIVKEITINGDMISGNTPYCLFYRKKSMSK